jgi:hypothetical protein
LKKRSNKVICKARQTFEPQLPEISCVALCMELLDLKESIGIWIGSETTWNLLVMRRLASQELQSKSRYTVDIKAGVFSHGPMDLL